jgi:hypothetical protein
LVGVHDGRTEVRKSDYDLALAAALHEHSIGKLLNKLEEHGLIRRRYEMILENGRAVKARYIVLLFTLKGAEPVHAQPAQGVLYTSAGRAVHQRKACSDPAQGVLPIIEARAELNSIEERVKKTQEECGENSRRTRTHEDLEPFACMNPDLPPEAGPGRDCPEAVEVGKWAERLGTDPNGDPYAFAARELCDHYPPDWVRQVLDIRVVANPRRPPIRYLVLALRDWRKAGGPPAAATMQQPGSPPRLSPSVERARHVRESIDKLFPSGKEQRNGQN